MNEQYFVNNVTECKKCGNVPTIVVDSDLLGVERLGYRVVCYNCEWVDESDDCEIKRYKTPEAALEAWNEENN